MLLSKINEHVGQALKSHKLFIDMTVSKMSNSKH